MRSAGLKFGVIGAVVLLIAAYVGSIMLYAQGGNTRDLETPAVINSDKSTATINIEDLQSNNSVLAVNLAFNAASSLLDPTTTTSRTISAFESDPRPCPAATRGPRACCPGWWRSR
jgi:hypothetical protein